MPFDGSGNFDRVHNFSADASAGIQAQAVRFDAELDGIATGLENCQTLTGETTPTADSPMGGFKHKAVAVATSTDNYLRADQSSNQVGIYVRDTNTSVSGIISASAAVFPTAFTDGQRVTVKVSADGSTSAPRAIIINGLSANIIDNRGSAFLSSKMKKDGIFDLIYDSSASAFRAITPRNDVSLSDVGVFGGTLTQMTAIVSASVDFIVTGKLCTLAIGGTGVAGSASGSAFTLTGLPVAVQPTDAIAVACMLQDNAVNVLGVASINEGSPSILTFSMGSPISVSGFTSAGTKGLPTGWVVTYPLE